MLYRIMVKPAGKGKYRENRRTLDKGTAEELLKYFKRLGIEAKIVEEQTELDNGKNKRFQFFQDHGYKNVSAFAEAVHEDASNVHKLLRGEQIPKIPKLLVYAGVLDVDVMKLLEIFYPDEVKEYKAIRKQKKEARNV